MSEAPEPEKPKAAKGDGDKDWVPKAPPTVPADFVVDEEKRFTGTVAFYSKLKGYGFIEVKDKGLVPEDRVFVHWRSIQSEDRFPFLVKETEVEFNMMKWREARGKNGEMSIRAKAVTMPGGAAIHLQNEIDAKEKSFIGGQEMRYSGTLKFYNPRAGYGYINVDPSHVVEGSEVPAELRVERSEVNAGGTQPNYMQNLAVEFGIWTTSKGIPKAYNVTLPGQLPITMERLENREAAGGQSYRGEVTMWNWGMGWGFIKADPSIPLPPNVQARLTKQTQDAIARAKERGREGSEEELLYVRKTDLTQGASIEKGTQVMFQVYLDDKGVGACNVSTI
jgi:cold shock CspA family protein|mmetsp:Transcript_46731/g.138040  ORF Transcript_46731/g.138040 Transcript_46731/m.138040 type:complete len:336 (+) Transcript_46731:51-1058(+)